jgi:plasmid maintenance system antidote protein VapI
LKYCIIGVIFGPMGELTKPLIEDLRDWCKKKWGRQSEAAKALGVSDSTVSDWFHDRKKLTGEQALAVQKFLKEKQ